MHSRHDRRCYTSDSLTLREGQSRTIAVAMAEHLVMARTYAPDCKLKEWEKREDGSITRAVLEDAAGKAWYVALNRISLYTPAGASEDKEGDAPAAKRRL